MKTSNQIKQLHDKYSKVKLYEAFKYCLKQKFGEPDENDPMKARWVIVFEKRILNAILTYKDISNRFNVTITPIKRVEDLVCKKMVEYLKGEI